MLEAHCGDRTWPKGEAVGSYSRLKSGQKGVASAPMAIVICANHGNSGVRENQQYYLVDCGIVFEHPILAACAQGWSTCWIGVFDERLIKKSFGIPEPWRVVAITPLGYPERIPQPRPRKTLGELVFAETWGKHMDEG